MLEYLREIGAPLLVPQQVTGPVEKVLAEYGPYLAHERGLAATTVQRHADLVRPFLTARVGAAGLDLTALASPEISRAWRAGEVKSAPDLR